MAEDADFEAGEDLDNLGDPIAELHGFEETASAGFVGRLLRSLGRRRLGSHVATLGWSGLGQVMLEFLNMIHSLFQSTGADEGETD